MPQLNNYATLIIDVTDVNDHLPNVLLTEVNGTRMTDRLVSVPECTPKGTPLFYIYVSDDDAGENGRVSCTLNDTRVRLVYLTTNAYSMQTTSTSDRFDYETQTFATVQLECSDFGQPSLSTAVLLQFQIEDCNDNAPEIISPLPFNQSRSIPYDTIEVPYLITQLIVDDRDRSQSNRFTYTFIVSPSLDLSLSSNGTLMLRSLPVTLGSFTVHVTVADSGNLTSTMVIPLDIYSHNDTLSLRHLTMEKTSLVLILSFFIIIFLDGLDRLDRRRKAIRKQTEMKTAARKMMMKNERIKTKLVFSMVRCLSESVSLCE